MELPALQELEAELQRSLQRVISRKGRLPPAARSCRVAILIRSTYIYIYICLCPLFVLLAIFRGRNTQDGKRQTTAALCYLSSQRQIRSSASMSTSLYVTLLFHSIAIAWV
jgi:hypothetical protein